MSVTEIIPPSKEIVVIEPTQALTVFTKDGAIDPYLEKIRKEIEGFTADASTAKGRKEIVSIAYRVAQSKTYLEACGKRLADEQKEIPKKIDATRRHIRETLDKWRDEVRAPLTAWEEAEKARVNKHNEAIRQIETAGGSVTSSADLWAALETVEAIVIGPDMQEFEINYARAKDAAVRRIFDAATAAEKREAEAAELERLRKAEEERLEQERINRIRLAAEEKAKAEAEAKVEAEREAAAKRESELKRQAEDAELRAADAEARAHREAEAARQREEEDAARREQDKQHLARINRAAVAAFVNGGMSEDAAKLAVTLIAKRSIPHVSISY